MGDRDRIVISWLGMRRGLGVIGLTHPIILYLGGVLIFGVPLQSSMSAYYYTPMGDVFVGLSFVTAFFMLSYHGYDKHDRIVSALGGLMSLIVGLFPAAPDVSPTPAQVTSGNIHVISAFILLASLAYFCLRLFPKSASPHLSPRKKSRNRIYRISGVLIIASLLFIGVYFYVPALNAALKPYHPIYFAELVSFWAFGIAWLTKGQAILPDR